MVMLFCLISKFLSHKPDEARVFVRRLLLSRRGEASLEAGCLNAELVSRWSHATVHLEDGT